MVKAVRMAVTVGLLAAALTGSFLGGVVADRLWLRAEPATAVVASSTATETTAAAADAERKIFDEVLQRIEADYYYAPVDKPKLTRAAAKALVAALDDAPSRYLTPEESAPAREQLQNEFDGIGVWVDTDDGRIRILAPMDGSPASRAGILANDLIVRIDGRDVSGSRPDQVLPLIRGKAGTVVRLGVRRPGVEGELEISVERARIEVSTVTYRVLADDIGYIRATVFGDKTTRQLDAALKALTERRVKGIILDLRDNGGGWVTAAREMVGRFVKSGTALVEVSRTGRRVDGVITSRDAAVYDLPLVVLVNGNSASASEIVAGALKDHGRATVVGERTFGKGSIQTVREFEDKSSLRLTTALWLTPKETTIEKAGITPDIVVGPDSNAPDDLLRPGLSFSRTSIPYGPSNPDGLTGPPDLPLERARQVILGGS